MMQAVANDTDYLSARLHGRYSQVARGELIEKLCQVQNLSELGRSIYPARQVQSAAELQRRLVQDLAGELSDLLANLSGPEAELFTWVLIRFRVENLKVMLRGVTHNLPPEELQARLLTLPRSLSLDTDSLAAAKSLEQFLELLPEETFRTRLQKAHIAYGDSPKPFFLEATLDQAYLEELIARTARLSKEDQKVVRPVISQELDLFNLMLVARGKHNYGIPPHFLTNLQASGGRISRAQFAAMLSEPDLSALARRAGPTVLGPDCSRQSRPITDASFLEDCAWNRLLALAERAFRRSPIGFGAVIGYAEIRRVEVANLITVSEGIRAKLGSEAIRARLIPRTRREPLHV